MSVYHESMKKTFFLGSSSPCSSSPCSSREVEEEGRKEGEGGSSQKRLVQFSPV
ncbi:hypothetical protein H8356DRAFT_1321296 [Neocallimastix lanati (nom. inval.)]|nr:hypothetical protein H8356DRAFT_1321296 [Neocallimastix sp. JGI-2020a]